MDVRNRQRLDRAAVLGRDQRDIRVGRHPQGRTVILGRQHVGGDRDRSQAHLAIRHQDHDRRRAGGYRGRLHLDPLVFDRGDGVAVDLGRVIDEFADVGRRVVLVVKTDVRPDGQRLRPFFP